MSKNLLGEYIAELTDFTANGSFADLRENVKYYNEYNYAALVRTTDLDKYNFQPEVFTDKNGYEFLVKSRLFGGEIIVANVGSVGKVFKVPYYSLPMTLGPNAYLVRFDKDKIDQEYAYQFLISDFFKTELYRKIGSTTLQAINKDNFRSIELFVPNDINNQQCIAKILSTCDAVIEKTQAAIAKYKAIKQGMLQDLFTRGIDLNTNKLRPRYQDAPELYKESKLGMIPVEWNEKVFGEEVDLIHGHQFRDYDFTEFGIPVVKIGQVKPENVDLSSCSFVAYGREDEFQNEIIRNGDVLMALTGATLGKACLVKGLNGVVLQNYRVGRFEPIIKENDIDKEFLYYLLIAGDLLTQIFNKVNTGAQGNIGKADFEKASFKKPPFDEQQKIAERLKAIDNKLQTEQTYLQKMQSLKKGLMEDLLSGRKQVKINEATTV